LPNLPVTHVAFAIVPSFPFPDESSTVDPVPSSNEYAATSPGVAADAGVVTAASDATASAVPIRARMRPRQDRPPVF
jgi:hypothetical protein